MTSAREQDKLNLVTSEVAGQRIVRAAGHIDSVTAPQFEEYLVALLAQGRCLGLDCSRLAYVSSAGISVLVATAKRIRGMEGRFEMFALTPMMVRMIELSGLSSILSVRVSEEDTLAALARA
jgi:anti-anti-sigma factor